MSNNKYAESSESSTKDFDLLYSAATWLGTISIEGRKSSFKQSAEWINLKTSGAWERLKKSGKLAEPLWSSRSGGKTAIHEAAYQGNSEFVMLLLAADSKLATITNKDGETPLHYAVMAADTYASLIIHNLIKVGGKTFMNARDSHGHTAIYRAARIGSVRAMKALWEVDPTVISRRDSIDGGNTALHVAAQQSHFRAVNFILNKAPKVEQLALKKNDAGNIALHLAAEEGHVKMVNALIKQALTSMRVKNKAGNIALHLAAEEGHIKVVNSLIKQDPTSTSITNHAGNIALHLAAEKGHVKVVNSLTKQDPTSTNVKNEFGETALMVALKQARIPVVKRLVKMGATIDNSDSRLRLWLAVIQDDVKSMKALVKKEGEKGPALLEKAARGGKTSLHLAAEAGSYNAAEWLITQNVPTNNFDNYETLPVERAMFANHNDIVRLMVEKGYADKDSLFELAAVHHKTNIVHYLLSKGIDPPATVQEQQWHIRERHGKEAVTHQKQTWLPAQLKQVVDCCQNTWQFFKPEERSEGEVTEPFLKEGKKIRDEVALYTQDIAAHHPDTIQTSYYTPYAAPLMTNPLPLLSLS